MEFLMAKGHNEEQARRHVADYDIIPLDIVGQYDLIISLNNWVAMTHFI